ncbi:MAG: hypothetical protein A2Y45_07960 [Tenericutes bacterium GWC2_34_14]|nr:MAG: hypothetical protein A2Z84_03720 [Tenericutes bacterium GWA2_35_7]OHE29833.1 MAG: hypothetical protein A2Y45_07960 [Tenericutes bacterium GWC2_34_14]OHE34812.1 MAG: hypothetical protein A2012_01570 [Tenericutes bacterium GWE2_34_108]OHE37327.1 MAG: hypothetical protein A2Y46_01440 [Tenericutes bacterium GWF1_35_14]OHE39540.1 MAG: hypothetical protein A2Y44_01420 [Tenericutes bacterium GWF2_35_184]OHE41952.1 MAG: hypothetical protein A3K26_02965 [Tenericutes bacterium RIFOXYA12_FULL_35_
MKKICHLVFQTHWDREWYYTFERYRYRLTHVIKRAVKALEDDEIAYFVLDGQTLPLEDYLEVCEIEERKKILSLIKQGRMIIGPWFIAMDEFLVQGESMIRNLELGHEIASNYGVVQKVGYLPDTFGHIGQMPQILKGFSIDNAFMWRGIALKDSEFMWEGADDSKLFTIYLVEGYYQPLINQPDYKDAIKAYVSKIESFSKSKDVLLTAGGDHLMPTVDSLSERIETFNRENQDIELQVSSYEIYANHLKNQLKNAKLSEIKGELRNNERAYILPNVLSTRSYLKQLNQQLEDQMIGYVEPMMALAYFNQKKAPVQYVKHIWKTILQNQPHDSICGCSIDEVHQENEMRALKASEMISSFKEGLLEQLKLLPMTYYGNPSKKIDQEDRFFTIYNPHPYLYEGMIKGTIWLTQNQDPSRIMLLDEKKRKIKVAVHEVKNHRLFVSPLEYPPVFRHGKTYEVVFYVKQLKPLSFTRYEVIEGESYEVKPSISKTLENKYLKLKLNEDGSLDITDKINQKTYHQWHQFYSSMDAGDSYNYSKPEQDTYSFAELEGEPVRKVSKLSQTLSYRLFMNQPESLIDSRKKASDVIVTTTMDITLTLNQNEKFIRVDAKIDQKGKDQRLRLKFPIGTKINNHISDSVFELVQRQSNRKEICETTRLKEVLVVVDSTLSMITGSNEDRGIRFYHLGLHEAQVVEENQKSTLEMTVIRSVSHLSRDDFKSRGGAAGPNLATPDAQCLRVHNFQYAFGPATATDDAVALFEEAQEFRKPPVLTRGYGTHKRSIFKKNKDGIQLTSLRWIGKYHIELRLWNPYHEVKTTTLSSDYIIDDIEEVSIDHTRKVKTSQTITFKPNEIKTVLMKYKSR